MVEQTDQERPGAADNGKPERHVNIQIDREHFKVESASMSGSQLRALPVMAVGPERDLFQVVPGGQDLKIADSDVVQLKSGMRFFTAPGQINPGA